MTIETRVSQDGMKSFRVKVRLKGCPEVSATFDRMTDARRWKQQTESAIREDRYFKSAEAKKHTLGETIDRYIENILPTKPRSTKQQKPQLLWWKREIGHLLLSDVSPAVIVDQRYALGRGLTRSKRVRAPSTVNRYLAVLSHTFSIAMRDWGWVDDSPFRRISKPKEPKGRERFLSEVERENLLQQCAISGNDYLLTIVVLALSTGMRCGEIRGLTWDAVNFDSGTITLHETKNGDTRSVTLANRARDLMLERSKVRRIDTNLVFPNSNYGEKVKPIDFRKAWSKALSKAGITNFRFHDLRHTAASYMAMSGATTVDIAGVLGHKTLQMVKRYAHLSESHTASVVMKMNERIFGVDIAKLEAGRGL